ncbi:MAG: class III extradiol dioxygenase subunit B-like domain-containing protein [Candidatus Komeilibacteria bacterium]|nr:class III extradiol dioxygenase subunit B-like domain-containing protein [Candidatus Komeilibacteria bacterium]
MSLIFSAFVPHSPVLLPTLGQEHLPKAQATIAALKQLEQELYAAKPETIIIISGHNEEIPNAFSLNHSPQLTANFKNFGDLKTTLNFTNNLGLAYKLKQKLETTVALQLTTPENLSYGISIPLFYLANHLPNIKIIPIQTSNLPLTAHWELGKIIRHEIDLVTDRVAIIAAGNLAHSNLESLTTQTDLAADHFNRSFLEKFQQKQTQTLLDIGENEIKDLEICGLKPALFLAGAVDGINYHAEVLSYEMPLGIGWAVMALALS